MTTEPTVVTTDSSGWPVAVIILILVIAGGAIWYFNFNKQAPAAESGTKIEVTLPAGGGQPEPNQ